MTLGERNIELALSWQKQQSPAPSADIHPTRKPVPLIAHGKTATLCIAAALVQGWGAEKARAKSRSGPRKQNMTASTEPRTDQCSKPKGQLITSAPTIQLKQRNTARSECHITSNTAAALNIGSGRSNTTGSTERRKTTENFGNAMCWHWKCGMPH